MKEKIGAVFASAVLVSGCQPNFSLTFGPDETPAAIDINSIPDTLPTAVAEQIPNVVALSSTQIGDKPLFSGDCSGVRISEYDYLSAGHCNLDLTNPIDDSHCQKITVASDPADVSVGLRGTSQRAVKTISIFGGPYPNNVAADEQTEDSYLVEVDAQRGPTVYTVPTRFSDNATTLAAGTPLFAINYEPTADNRFRNPQEAILSPRDLKDGLSQPVILGAFVLRYMSNGFIEVVSANQPYSNPPEVDIRPGASGGPVYDSNGNLVGTIIAIYAKPYTVDDIEEQSNVDLVGISNDATINRFLVQPVSESRVDELQSQQQTIPFCAQ